ncbi:Cupin domain protein [Nonomuraea maritima]|uniref:Cupin domain protein n=1 Tax=Nonomuraea maritima TaxID=683260 RepID=A0A1G9EVT6_9ACTN|nr:cupin domain-containing protein [Nonomuraea maritima]SDK80244.1 Cupin domain protein [Nonomuraea maritima]
MVRVRFARGLLAAGMLVSVAACAGERAASGAPAAVERPVAAVTTQPPSDKLTKLLEQPLPNVKGKTFTSAIVDFPPGARAAPHRHGQAFVYAYVLEGSVRSRLDDEPVKTFRKGENWVEPPGSHHVLADNASRTEPAKLLVVFISDSGEQIKVDD